MKLRLEEFSLLSGTKRFSIWQGNKHVANFADFQDAQAFLAIPDLLEACKDAFEIISTARNYFPKSIQNRDKFALENTCSAIGKAIAKAEGKE